MQRSEQCFHLSNQMFSLSNQRRLVKGVEGPALGGMLPFQMVKCPGHEVELRVPERTESQREGAKAHLLRPPKGEGNAAPEEDQRLQTPPIILNILDIIKDHARLFTVCITSLT